MTQEEALHRFKGDLEFMRQVSSHTTDTMRMYEHAIAALEVVMNNDLISRSALKKVTKNFTDCDGFNPVWQIIDNATIGEVR